MTSTTVDRRLGLTGNKAYKAPAHVATTGNITLSGEQSIDGVTTDESRVVVWQQTNPVDNGIWNSGTGAWTRAVDANTNQDIAKGTQVLVTSGTTYAGNVFEFTTTDPIQPGTSSITIVRLDNGTTLAARLASTVLAADGAGMVGYDGTDAYATATVGGQLNRLAEATSAANGDAMVAVKRTDTGAVATTVHALRERQLLDPIEFGAVPDYAGTPGAGTDNSSAFRLMAAAINTAGGGGIDLGRGRYRVFSDGSTVALFAFASLRGVTIKSDGAEIVVDRTFTGSQTVRVFEFTACNNIVFSGGIKGTCTQAQPSGEHTSRGPQWCELLQGCVGFMADAVDLRNFREGPHAIRAYNDPQSYVCRNLDFGLIRAYQCGYPLSGSLSGYNVKATLETEQCGRSYFWTGGEDHDIVVRSKNHQASVDCLIATDRCNDSGSSLGAGMIGLRLKYSNHESTGADNSLNCVDIQVQQSDLYVGTHRDIDIELDIKNSAAGVYLGYGASISKIKDDGTADATDRGHVWDGIKIHGVIQGASGNQRAITLARLGTFGSGENFRNFDFSRLRMDTLGQPSFGLTPLKDVATFTNVYSSAQMNIVGNATANIVCTAVKCDGSLTVDTADTSRCTYIGCNFGSLANQSVLNKTFVDCIGLSSSYTGTLTGCTTSPTGAIDYSVTGDTVTLRIPAIQATSNTTACTVTGMPVQIRPQSTQLFVARHTDNNVDAIGLLRVETSGVLTLFNEVGSSTFFTAAGVKGIGQITITYRMR